MCKCESNLMVLAWKCRFWQDCSSLAFNPNTLWPFTPAPSFSCSSHTKKYFPSSYPQEKLSRLIPSFDPEGVVCVDIHVGGLNLKDVRWHGPVRLDAHVFVDNWWREPLALCLRPADTAAANTQTAVTICLQSWLLMRVKQESWMVFTDFSEVLV